MPEINQALKNLILNYFLGIHIWAIIIIVTTAKNSIPRGVGVPANSVVPTYSINPSAAPDKAPPLVFISAKAAAVLT